MLPWVSVVLPGQRQGPVSLLTFRISVRALPGPLAGKARAWAWPLQRAWLGSPRKRGNQIRSSATSGVPVFALMLLPKHSASSVAGAFMGGWFVSQNWPLSCAQPCPRPGATRPSRGSTRHLRKQWGLRRQKEAGVQGVLGCWGRLGGVTARLLSGCVFHEHLYSPVFCRERHRMPFCSREGRSPSPWRQ